MMKSEMGPQKFNEVDFERVPEKTYPGKILLFGEYTVLTGGVALTVPYRKVTGHFDYLSDNSPLHHASSNKQLAIFCNYLSEMSFVQFPAFKPDLIRLGQDIEKGLFFYSDIPVGYGVGSSGALVAAIFEKYSQINNDGIIDLNLLKKYLGEMESFFHGRSSGIDPLSCYLQKPLFFRENHTEVLETLEMNGINIFLLDTGGNAATTGLVSHFLERDSDPEFHKMIEDKLKPLISLAVESLLCDGHNFLPHVHNISELQYKFFKEMIPGNMQSLWAEGLKDQEFYLKLCGSGGGGYLLGFTTKPKNKLDINADIVWYD